MPLPCGILRQSKPPKPIQRWIARCTGQSNILLCTLSRRGMLRFAIRHRDSSSIGSPDFPENLVNVIFYRGDGNEEPRGDFFVGSSLCNE